MSALRTLTLIFQWVVSCILLSDSVVASVYINEILFNPPGSDTPNEYIELRGDSNYLLREGTYLINVEGDMNGNPGTIQNIFDLSSVRVGGNGFIVLLQKDSPYTPVLGATILKNSGSGPGWGSGSTSSIKHYGENGQTELENPSCTFMLIQTSSKPSIGMDIDADNDGYPDSEIYTNWVVLDSIGILDSSGAGDIAYGLINYRANSAATSITGRTLEINFTPSYVGRLGNTTYSTENDWLVSDNLGGSLPVWLVGPPGSTLPTGFSMAPLNNIGAPNFNAFLIPGVIVSPISENVFLSENGGTNAYSIRLNTQPYGMVTAQISTDGQTLISTNNGNTFFSTGFITFSNTNAIVITVKAIDDNIVETAIHKSVITHSISYTEDNLNYPPTSIVADIVFYITDNDSILLNEIKVNPPGEDSPFEFVEIIGQPSALLKDVYFLVIEGNGDKNPGKVDFILNLDGTQIGSNGLLLLCASNSPYLTHSNTSVYYVPEFSNAGGGLLNGCASFLLLSTTNPPYQGRDLDDDNNGTLEDLSSNVFIYDAVGWTSHRTNDLVYGGVDLNLPKGTPDAATRFSQNLTRLSSSAWFYGQLFGDTGGSLEYDEFNASSNFPSGLNMTPGLSNISVLIISKIDPISGVIGDATNPEVYFSISNTLVSPTNLIITVSANNSNVVSNLTLTRISGYNYKLTIEPCGVGYASISIVASFGNEVITRSFLYAASDMGRSGGLFMTGASDASAAIAIDGDWMFVGDDENETIRIYSRKRSGAPITGFTMTPYLGLTDFEGERPREVDIEAAYRIGNRIYWIGAHSNANLAEGRTNRARIFVTDIIGSGTNSVLTYVGRYDNLKSDLVDWDLNNGHGKGAGFYNLDYSTQDGVNPKTPWGFNIEGIAPAPNNPAAAYIGLRAPIVPPTNRVHTLIIPVLNFTNIAGSDAAKGSAIFGEPIEIDLFGRGIRDIVGDSNGYIIIAGTPLNTPGPYPDDFKIFTWSGYPSDQPQERSVNLTGLVPEGIVELPPHPWTEDTTIQLISDCGTQKYYGDGVQAKSLPYPGFKKFRVDTVKLGKIVKSAPLFKNISYKNGGIEITWRSIVGDRYQVQYQSIDVGGNWETGNTMQAISEWTTFFDNNLNNRGKVYRIIVLP